MEYDHTYNGAGDWSFPSPTATPTSASFNQGHFHTPKTLPSQFFQDAFSTPQMPGYATPRQPEYPQMAQVQQRPQPTSSDTLRSNFYANMQASGGAVPGQVMPPPVQAAYQVPSPIYGYNQPPPAAPGQTAPFDISHMQTPPPTRGTSVKKPDPSQQPVAFGTPSTIASRRLVTPQQANPAQQQQIQGQQNAPMPFPHLHFSPDVYQFGNLGPASAPVFPQTQLLWEQTASPTVYSQPQQQNLLDDPFAPATSAAMGWQSMSVRQQNMQPANFGMAPANAYPVQVPVQRPASANPIATNPPPPPPLLPSSISSSAGVDPSLVYSSPVRPVVQSVPRQSKPRGNVKKPGTTRKDSAHPDQQRADGPASVQSVVTPVSKAGLRRSNTVATARPSTAQTSLAGDSFSRNSSSSQVPRTASPLKRVGRVSLGSISENSKTSSKRASVILTIDENGRARTETTREDSPEKAMRERYPGLFDSDSSDDGGGLSDDEEQMPSRTASFSFAKGEERKSKMARLDAPVENLEGLNFPRSSSAASMKVTPSRAAISAAAQLRRSGSLRKQTPTRRAASNAASAIDKAPMDLTDRRQSMISNDELDLRNNFSNTSLDAHNRRWSMMSMEQQSSVSPTHPPVQTPLASQQSRQPILQNPLIRCICGTSSDRGALIQCRSCTQFVHSSCVGLDPTAVPPGFTCFLCTRPAKVGSRRQ